MEIITNIFINSIYHPFIVFSVFMYAAKTWAVKVKDKKRTNSFEI